MNLTAVSVCVGYDDYLAETLPYNRPHVDSFVVVTDRRSPALEALASRYDLTLVETALSLSTLRSWSGSFSHSCVLIAFIYR